MKYYFFFLFVLTIGLSCNNVDLDKIVDKQKLIGNDYRLFQETPSWLLAKAVYNDDLVQIEKIIKEDTLVDINFQEPIWGQTLLNLAIHSQKYDVSKLLLELGANPNIHDFRSGSSALIEAADDEIQLGDKAKFVKLLLQYGANPNDEEVIINNHPKSFRHSALNRACINNLDVVKALVEAGADVNYNNETNSFPLGEAAIQENYEIVLYLLEKGADPSRVVVTRPNGMQLRLADLLKEDEAEGMFFLQKISFNKVKKYLQSKGIY